MPDDIAGQFRCADKTYLGYLPVYQRLAAEIGPAGKVLEVGIDQGVSLRLWQALFPDGLVVGADDGSGAGGSVPGSVIWPPGTMAIRAGQDDPRIAAEAAELSPDGYDLIVDDASHDGKLSQATFGLLWPLVKPGRWYVLEDWWLGYLPWARERYGDSMLRAAESFLPMLGGPPWEDRYPAGIDVLEYRPGQVIIHKWDGVTG